MATSDKQNGIIQGDEDLSKDSQSAEIDLNYEQTIDVLLPDHSIRKIKIPASTSWGDVQSQLLSHFKLTPSSHRVEFVSTSAENNAKASSLFGGMDVAMVTIEEKNTNSKPTTPHVMRKDQKATVRLMVKLPHSRQSIMRVDPDAPLALALAATCDKLKLSDEAQSGAQFRHPTQHDVTLNLKLTLNHYNLRGVYFLQRPDPLSSLPPPYPESLHTKRKAPPPPRPPPPQIFTRGQSSSNNKEQSLPPDVKAVALPRPKRRIAPLPPKESPPSSDKQLHCVVTDHVPLTLSKQNSKTDDVEDEQVAISELDRVLDEELDNLEPTKTAATAAAPHKPPRKHKRKEHPVGDDVTPTATDDLHPTDDDGQTTYDNLHPTVEDEQPTDDDLHPTDDVRQKTDDHLHRTDDNEQSTDDHVHQTDDDEQPIDDHLHPTDDNKQTTDDHLHPTHDDSQPTDDEEQPTNDFLPQTDDGEQPIDDHLHPTDDVRQKTDDHLHRIDDNEPPTDSHLHRTDDNEQPTDDHLHQTDDDEQPIDDRRHPTHDDSQPTDDGEQPTNDKVHTTIARLHAVVDDVRTTADEVDVIKDGVHTATNDVNPSDDESNTITYDVSTTSDNARLIDDDVVEVVDDAQKSNDDKHTTSSPSNTTDDDESPKMIDANATDDSPLQRTDTANNLSDPIAANNAHTVKEGINNSEYLMMNSTRKGGSDVAECLMMTTARKGGSDVEKKNTCKPDDVIVTDDNNYNVVPKPADRALDERSEVMGTKNDVADVAVAEAESNIAQQSDASKLLYDVTSVIDLSVPDDVAKHENSATSHDMKSGDIAVHSAAEEGEATAQNATTPVALPDFPSNFLDDLPPPPLSLLDDAIIPPRDEPKLETIPSRVDDVTNIKFQPTKHDEKEDDVFDLRIAESFNIPMRAIGEKPKNDNGNTEFKPTNGTGSNAVKQVDEGVPESEKTELEIEKLHRKIRRMRNSVKQKEKDAASRASWHAGSGSFTFVPRRNTSEAIHADFKAASVGGIKLSNSGDFKAAHEDAAEDRLQPVSQEAPRLRSTLPSYYKKFLGANAFAARDTSSK